LSPIHTIEVVPPHSKPRPGNRAKTQGETQAKETIPGRGTERAFENSNTETCKKAGNLQGEQTSFKQGGPPNWWVKHRLLQELRGEDLNGIRGDGTDRGATNERPVPHAHFQHDLRETRGGAAQWPRQPLWKEG